MDAPKDENSQNPENLDIQNPENSNFFNSLPPVSEEIYLNNQNDSQGLISDQFAEIVDQPLIDPFTQTPIKNRTTKYIILAILFVVLICLIIYFYYVKNKKANDVIEPHLAELAVNNNTNNNLIVNANSNNSITNNNNTSTLKEEPKKVSVSSRVVPKIPDSGWKDAALPSKKVSYKIPLNVVLNENIINEVDPNQKDQRAYFYGSDYGALPLILADHWDKNAAGADKSMAATYGKDEESFVQSLESQKIDFTEENIIIDNKLAKLIFVGSNASKMSFYCSIVQTVSGEFFSYTFSPKDDSTVNIDLVMFEKFLGSIKY